MRDHQQRTERPWTLDPPRWQQGQAQGRPWQAGKSSEQTHLSSLWLTSELPVGSKENRQTRISITIQASFPSSKPSRANASVLSHRLITVPMTAVFKLLRLPKWKLLHCNEQSILHVILDPALADLFFSFSRADYLIPLTWDDLSSIHISLPCRWWVSHSRFMMMNTVSQMLLTTGMTLCGWLTN